MAVPPPSGHHNIPALAEAEREQLSGGIGGNRGNRERLILLRSAQGGACK